MKCESKHRDWAAACFAILSSMVMMQVSSTASAQFFALQGQANAANKGDQKAPEFLKSLINVELSFVNRVCDPTDDQMKQIVSAAKVAHTEMNDIVRGAGNRRVILPQQQAVRMVGPNNEQLVQNPYIRVRQDVAKCVKPILNDDQYERYVKEAADRARFEKQTAVDIVLGMLDDKVALTPQQRETISKQMMAKWDGIDIEQMQLYLNNSQYVPSVSTQFLNGVLTAKQMAAWKSHRSVSFSHSLSVSDGSGLDENWIE